MSFDATATATEIETVLRLIGTPARAESEKRYLKSILTFLGATSGRSET